jgi:two-component system CheB/CheR fusion protein
VTTAQESLSHDLHDGVAQLVTGIELTAAALHEALSSERSPQANTAVRLVEQARSAQKEIRDLIKGVHRHAVPAGGLEAELRGLAKELEPAYGIRGVFQRRGRTKADNIQVATQLHHIAREAMFNAVKHSGAKTITVCLEGDAERLVMSIRDDGAGLANAKSKSARLGMEIMRYRASLIDAMFDVKSTKRGVTVTCTVSRRAGG